MLVGATRGPNHDAARQCDCHAFLRCYIRQGVHAARPSLCTEGSGQYPSRDIHNVARRTDMRPRARSPHQESRRPPKTELVEKTLRRYASTNVELVHRSQIVDPDAARCLAEFGNACQDRLEKVAISIVGRDQVDIGQDSPPAHSHLRFDTAHCVYTSRHLSLFAAPDFDAVERIAPPVGQSGRLFRPIQRLTLWQYST